MPTLRPALTCARSSTIRGGSAKCGRKLRGGTASQGHAACAPLPTLECRQPRNGPRRVICVGGAERALWLARAELSAADAWDFHRELATTTAGEQPIWPVDEAQGDFAHWAGEAAAGRL